MEVLDVIDMIKETLRIKRKEYEKIPSEHLLIEIKVLESLLSNGANEDESREEENEDDNLKFFNIKSGKDILSLFYNKKDTEYYVKYKDEIVFDTRENSYYHFKNTGKTWRYRDSMIRVELARGLDNISYTIRNEVKIWSNIKVSDIKKLLSKMMNWILLNEVPEEYRDRYWKEKSEIIKKEND